MPSVLLLPGLDDESAPLLLPGLDDDERAQVDELMTLIQRNLPTTTLYDLRRLLQRRITPAYTPEEVAALRRAWRAQGRAWRADARRADAERRRQADLLADEVSADDDGGGGGGVGGGTTRAPSAPSLLA